MDALKHIDRLYVDGILPQFVMKCPESFINQLCKIEINYSSKTIESEFWKSFQNKCNKNLRTLKLRNIIISKQTYQPLIKFISGCKNLNEFECHRWRFSNANMTINGTIKALSEQCRHLKILRIEYCRINDKAITYITKLMEYKLRSLAIINCNRLKMTTLSELGRKQQELLSKSNENFIKSKQKCLFEFIIDDKMISGSIFDNLCGLKTLSISADHLSGTLSYSSLNRYNSLRNVTIQFRSSIDRLKSHSSSTFNWKLFFEELGKTLVYFECNCQVIENQKKSTKQKIKSTDNNNNHYNISNLKLVSKEDYENFMILDFNIFIYITTYCKRLKVLKMSGWKFDATKAKLDLDGTNDFELDEAKDEVSDIDTIRISRQRSLRQNGRSNSLYFEKRGKHNKLKTQQIVSLNNITSKHNKNKSKITYTHNGTGRFDFSDNATKSSSTYNSRHSASAARPATTRYTPKNKQKRDNHQISMSPALRATTSTGFHNDSINSISSLSGLTPTSTESILTMENLIMIPISNLLQSQSNNNKLDDYKYEKIDEQQMDYMKLEWMFDFGDIPSLNTLNFWSDTVLGLNCQMSMTEDMKAGSVLIMEWNQNWTNFIRPTIIHHQSGDNKNNSLSHKLYKTNTKQRLRKMRRQRENAQNTNDNATNQ